MLKLPHPTAQIVRDGSRLVIQDGVLEFGFIDCSKDPRHGTPFFAAHAYLPKENGVFPTMFGDFDDFRAACAFVLEEGVAV